MNERPLVLVESRAEWRGWLEQHHSTSSGIWLVRWKKASGRPWVSYDDVVEEALCFGWIDSLQRTLDDERSQLMLTPRKPGSRWSAVNKERVDRMTAAGLMCPTGAALVAAAKEDGTWNALDQVDALIEPADLSAALDADPLARRAWDAFPPSAKRGILERILDARTEPTRLTRIRTVVTEAHEGRRAFR